MILQYKLLADKYTQSKIVIIPFICISKFKLFEKFK